MFNFFFLVNKSLCELLYKLKFSLHKLATTYEWLNLLQIVKSNNFRDLKVILSFQLMAKKKIVTISNRELIIHQQTGFVINTTGDFKLYL